MQLEFCNKIVALNDFVFTQLKELLNELKQARYCRLMDLEIVTFGQKKRE